MFLPSEAHAFAALVVLMEERGLKKFYSRCMSLLQVSIAITVLKCLCFVVCRVLVSREFFQRISMPLLLTCQHPASCEESSFLSKSFAPVFLIIIGELSICLVC